MLADCLAHAVALGAERIVDVATLTGAIVTALGHTYAGLFANDDAWAAEVGAAGERHRRADCGACRCTAEYAELIKGTTADLAQRGRGAQGRARSRPRSFLQRFVGDVPWAHLDIAGTAWDLGRAYAARAAAGFGVRLLTELAALRRAHGRRAPPTTLSSPSPTGPRLAPAATRSTGPRRAAALREPASTRSSSRGWPSPAGSTARRGTRLRGLRRSSRPTPDAAGACRARVRLPARPDHEARRLGRAARAGLAAPGRIVELHWRLPGLGADPARAWAKLWARRASRAVGEDAGCRCSTSRPRVHSRFTRPSTACRPKPRVDLGVSARAPRRGDLAAGGGAGRRARRHRRVLGRPAARPARRGAGRPPRGSGAVAAVDAAGRRRRRRSAPSGCCAGGRRRGAAARLTRVGLSAARADEMFFPGSSDRHALVAARSPAGVAAGARGARLAGHPASA